MVHRDRIVLITAGCLAAGLLWVLPTLPSPVAELKESGATPAPGAAADTRAPVRVAVARLGTLTLRLTSSGRLRPAREITLCPQVAGELDSLPARTGRRVGKGALLARLDQTEFRLRYEHARLALLGARIEYQTLSESPYLGRADSAARARAAADALRGLQEQEAAFEQGRVTPDQYRRERRRYEAAAAYATAERADVVAWRSGLAQAADMFERAAAELASTELRAPFAGIVADCAALPGMHLSPGMPLLRLIDESVFCVDAELPEAELCRVPEGAGAWVSLLALPDRTLRGRVTVRHPAVDPRSGTFLVTVTLARQPREPDLLRAGMYATVALEVEQLAGRLLVPRQALLVRDERTVLFTVSQGTAAWRYVQTGESNDSVAEVRAGILAGDTVVVDGQFNLVHGAGVCIAADPEPVR